LPENAVWPTLNVFLNQKKGNFFFFFNLQNRICWFWVGFFNQTPWLLWLLYLVFDVIKWIPARFGGYSHSTPSRFADGATRSKIEQKPRKMAKIQKIWVFSTVAHWDTCFSSPQPVPDIFEPFRQCILQKQKKVQISSYFHDFQENRCKSSKIGSRTLWDVS
jgi:hypothetical protein